MAHHVAPDGKIYVDTAFINKVQRLSGMSVRHMGFGEFTLETSKGEVEFDRMRGKDFPGKSGRSHQFYDTKGGQKIAEWVIEQMEGKGISERMASQKLASPNALASELNRILAFAQEPNPSREAVSQQLRDLANRL